MDFVELAQTCVTKRLPAATFVRIVVQSDVKDAGVSISPLLKAPLDLLAVQYVVFLACDPSECVTIGAVLDAVRTASLRVSLAVLQMLAQQVMAGSAVSVDSAAGFLDSIRPEQVVPFARLLTKIELEGPERQSLVPEIHRKLVGRVSGDLALLLVERFPLSPGAHPETRPEVLKAPEPNQPRLRPSRVLQLTWLYRAVGSSSYRPQSDLEFWAVAGDGPGEDKYEVLASAVLACFNCLAVALLQQHQTAFKVPLWKQFMVKRLPLIVKRFTMEHKLKALQCSRAIESTIMSLDRPTVNLLRISGGGDALDEMFASFPSTTSDTRHQFLQALVDLEVIESASPARALGAEASGMALESPAVQYGPVAINALLINQGQEAVTLDQAVLKMLQEDVDYVGFGASIINQILGLYKDLDGVRQEYLAHKLVASITATTPPPAVLRRLCQCLAVHRESLDALVLHVPPHRLLAPITAFIESFIHDENDMSVQDSYTDLGSALLLIMLMVQRYDLTRADLACAKTGFLMQVLRNEFVEDFSDRDEEGQNTNQGDDSSSDMSAWINALFDQGGISDELMRATPFKHLYSLVPMLFEQVLTACSRNVVDFEVIKGGLDYFLQPFLLGTLVTALNFLMHYLWEVQDVMTAIQIVNWLARTSSSAEQLSEEALAMHGIVLAIVADRLAIAVEDRKCRGDSQLDPVLAILEPYLSPSNNKPRPSGNATGAVTQQVALLVSWEHNTAQSQAQAVAVDSSTADIVGSADPVVPDGPSFSPPGAYDPSTLTVAIELLGATKVLDALVQELSLSELQGSLTSSLDVVAALVVSHETICRSSLTPDRVQAGRLESVSGLADSSLLALLKSNDRPVGDPAQSYHEKLKQKVNQLLAVLDAVCIYDISPDDIKPTEAPGLPDLIHNAPLDSIKVRQTVEPEKVIEDVTMQDQDQNQEIVDESKTEPPPALPTDMDLDLDMMFGSSMYGDDLMNVDLDLPGDMFPRF